MKRKLLSIGILIMITLLAGCSAAGQYDKAGKQNFESGDYKNAADNFSKAVKENPNRADYYVDYGMALTALGRYEDAIKQFDCAYINKDLFIIKENNKKALRGKGIAYYNMQAYEKAISMFEKALKINELSGLNVDILYYMGNSYRIIGSYQKAVDSYTSILSENKKNAEAYAERAYCYKCLKQYDESRKDYDSAISLKPDDFDYYFGKYNLLIVNGDTADANEVLKKAAQIKIKTDTDSYNLAKLHYYQGNYDTALSELNQSLTGGYKEADYFIGEIYREEKNYSKAVYYYENYIKADKVLIPDVYNQIAVCLIKTGEYKKSLEYLEKGISFGNTETIQILKKNEIIVYENMGDFDTAKEKLKDYLESYPKDKGALRESEFVDTR